MIQRLANAISKVPSCLAVLLILAFQSLIRPFLLGTCRYCPSCSHYAIESLRVHGFLRGCYLTMGRLLRCRPFARGGIDPVPPRSR